MRSMKSATCKWSADGHIFSSMRMFCGILVLFAQVTASQKNLMNLMRGCADGAPSNGDCRAAGYEFGKLEQSRSGKRDIAAVIAALKKGCDAGTPMDCNMLGTAYAFGGGVTKDPARARSLYATACNANLASACSNLGDTYPAEEAAQAAPFYEKACAGGFLSACTEIATNFLQGEKKDTPKAFALADKACTGGDARGCALAAFLTYAGDGVPRDLVKAARGYKKACDAREMRGCQGLRQMYEDDEAAARAAFKSACGDDKDQCAEFEAFITGIEAVRALRKR